MEDLQNDPFAEVEAMRAVANALKPLKPDAIARVLRWALDSHKVHPTQGTSAADKKTSTDIPSQGFPDAAELFAAARPQSGPDKALAVAYWLQVVREQPDFEAQSVNSELKHLGHRLANVTSTLNALMAQRPQLVVQLKKSGSSRQARKRYKLTQEGRYKVEEMLRGEADQVQNTEIATTHDGPRVTPESRVVGHKPPGKAKKRATSKESIRIIKDLNLRGNSKVPSFKDFCKEKAPSSNIEFNAVAVYYLARLLELTSITPAHINTCYKESSRRPPGNFRQSLWDASSAKYGYIETKDINDIRIPHRGEAFVEHDLPKGGKSPKS